MIPTPKQLELLKLAANGLISKHIGKRIFSSNQSLDNAFLFLHQNGYIELAGYGQFKITEKGVKIIKEMVFNEDGWHDI